MKTGLIILIVVTVLVGIGGGVLYWYVASQAAKNSLDVEAADRAADVRVLFIGNSFTNYHDMHIMTERLLEEAVPEWDDALVVRHAPDGRRLTEHNADLSEDGSALNQALLTGSATLRDWDYVILQEQSQIPGFGTQSNDFQQSQAAALTIGRAAYNDGAKVALFMTWGYLNGDDSNPNAYPDYLTMQQRISDGYDNIASYLNTQGLPATVIPVGLGFRYIYFELYNRGVNVMRGEPQFRDLYAPDGRHPSVAGSYLVACMTTAAITGRPVRPLTYHPADLDAGYAAYIREAVDQVVFNGALGWRVYAFQQ